MSTSPSPTTPHPKHWDTPCFPIGVYMLPFESLYTQHSGTDHQSVGRLSSSLPLQSAPYASTSPRALHAPQRALNALSSTQMRSSCACVPYARTPTRPDAFSSTPDELTAHFRLHAFSRAHLLHGAVLRTIAIQRLLAPRVLHAQPLLAPRALFTSNRCFHGFPFPPSSPVGEPAKLNPFRASRNAINFQSTAAVTAELKG